METPTDAAGNPETTPQSPAAPRFGVGAIVRHPAFGPGRVVGYEENIYLVLFREGEVRRIAFSFGELSAPTGAGDPELSRIRQAVAEALEDYGWLDVELEMGRRWTGGVMKLIPGKEGTQPKEIPLEAFFKKIISVRDKLRVLEQKINAHPGLSAEEKVEMEGYITRCYGSLTSFNILFRHKESQFKGVGKEE
ncbi:MAG TPA: hypothetical protein P5137_14175 [Candidatus Brocadiia bacterium]|nr:hypothetical protein [Candidatus Brocadiia bacterium]